MADDHPIDEEEFSTWLASQSTEEDEVEEVEEEETPPVVERLEKKVDHLLAAEQEKKRDDLIDAFMSKAPEDAKRLFSIWQTGKEDAKQLKALMELANVKAQEAAKTEEAVAEEAEKKAAEIAREQYGVGPLQSGAPTPELSEEEKQYNAMFNAVTTQGDPNALLGLMAEDSEFIDAVLTGKPLRKK